MFKNLDALLDYFIEERKIPGNDCIVMKDGKVVYRRQRGFSDREAQIPMNGKELFNIYSCSKFLTAVAALQLWEKGLFKLDDPLCEYIPEYAEMKVGKPDDCRPAQKRITIRNLFTMTAGFGYSTMSPGLVRAYEETEGQCPTVAMMKGLASDPLYFEPGEYWNYSLCHDVLAALVEILSGQRFGLYVKEHIFDVVGMPDSTFLLPPERLPEVAAQYRYSYGKDVCHRIENDISSIIKGERSIKMGPLYESGGAGCVSKIDDYIKFLEAIREGETLLKRDTIELMKTNQLNEQQMSTFWMKEGFGYGLGVRCPQPGAEWRCDFGWGGAAGAYMGVDDRYGFTFYYGQHVLRSIEEAKPRICNAIRKDLVAAGC